MLQNLTGWHAVLILAVILLVFGSAKLPALARSVGQSMRILKAETSEPRTRRTAETAETVAPVEQVERVEQVQAGQIGSDADAMPTSEAHDVAETSVSRAQAR